MQVVKKNHRERVRHCGRDGCREPRSRMILLRQSSRRPGQITKSASQPSESVGRRAVYRSGSALAGCEVCLSWFGLEERVAVVAAEEEREPVQVGA
jgi:hypothetical protein